MSHRVTLAKCFAISDAYLHQNNSLIASLQSMVYMPWITTAQLRVAIHCSVRHTHFTQYAAKQPHANVRHTFKPEGRQTQNAVAGPVQIDTAQDAGSSHKSGARRHPSRRRSNGTAPSVGECTPAHSAAAKEDGGSTTRTGVREAAQAVMQAAR